jgi:hypothetical protein
MPAGSRSCACCWLMAAPPYTRHPSRGSSKRRPVERALRFCSAEAERAGGVGLDPRCPPVCSPEVGRLSSLRTDMPADRATAWWPNRSFASSSPARLLPLNGSRRASGSGHTRSSTLSDGVGVRAPRARSARVERQRSPPRGHGLPFARYRRQVANPASPALGARPAPFARGAYDVGRGLYSSSVTRSPQMTGLPVSSTSRMTMWVMKRLGAAPRAAQEHELAGTHPSWRSRL